MNKQQNTRRKLQTALLVTAAISLWNPAGPARAITPGINPNADSPSTGDVDTGSLDTGSLDIGGDLGGTTGSSAPLNTDPFESIVGEIDTGIDDIGGSVGDIEGGVGEIGGGIDDIGSGDVGDGLGDVTGGVGSVIGGIDSITSTINGIFEQISALFNPERILDLLNIEIPDIASDPLGGLEGEVAIEPGPLGLPSPEVIEEEIQNAQSSGFEEVAAALTGGDGSPVVKMDLVTQFESELTDEVANATALTEEGQQKLLENTEAAVATLEASQELATDSEEQDVSQNILRNISSQLAMAQQTGTLDTIDRQLQRRDSALRNITLANAVRELQGSRIQDRRETAAAYSDAITQGGQLILPGKGIDPAGG